MELPPEFRHIRYSPGGSMLKNPRLVKIGLSLLSSALAIAIIVAWISSYHAPVYVRYGDSFGEVWCVFDRGLVQLELNHGHHNADGWVINDMTGLDHWGWHELQILRPGWRAHLGLSTWSYYLGRDNGVIGKPAHGRVIFFPLAPALIAGLLLVLIATRARRRVVHSTATQAATA
jgi:hypothetical protein